jgi:hypothetical protein
MNEYTTFQIQKGNGVLPCVSGSVLIAEFLGSKFINDAPEDFPNGYYYQPEDLEIEVPTGEPDEWCFNSSWDWLMPVYRKIRDIINERSKYDKHTRANYDLLELDVQMAVCEVDIEKAFDSTVKFIECWNASQADR